MKRKDEAVATVIPERFPYTNSVDSTETPERRIFRRSANIGAAGRPLLAPADSVGLSACVGEV